MQAAEKTNDNVGDGTTTDRSEPTLVAGISGVTAVGLGSWFSCVAHHDGAVECWGANTAGQLGDGTAPTDSQVGVNVSGLGGKGLTLTVNSALDDPDTNAGNGVCATITDAKQIPVLALTCALGWEWQKDVERVYAELESE